MNTVTRGKAKPRLAGLCALLVAVVACWQARDTVGFAFVEFDDSINIYLNPHLGPPSWDTLSWMFGDMAYMRRYVPLGWLGFSLAYGVSGLSPVGYHTANVALHAVNSLLVFWLILALVRRFAASTEENWRVAVAVIGAWWWSLHPFRAETIGWASGLLYGAAGCFALLSVLAYLQAWAPGAPRRRWLVGALLLYAASMLVYPMSLGLMGVFVLIDCAYHRESPEWSWRQLVMEKLFLAVPFVAILAVTSYASYTAPEFWTRPPSWAEFGAGARLQQTGLVWVYYLLKPWWPTGLTPAPTWLVDFTGGGAKAAASLVLVVGVSLLLLAGWRRWRGVALLWFAHAALLGPMLGFMEHPFFSADRYHYLAGVVMATAVALWLTRVAGKARSVFALVCGAGLVALGVAQRHQLAIWADTDSLMQRIVACAEHKGMRGGYQSRWIRVQAHRGDLARAGEIAAKAGIPLQQVVEPPPGGVPMLAALHLRLARDFRRDGRRTEAREHFRAALDLVPDWNEAAYNWALLQVGDGDAIEALRWYRRAAAPGRGNPVPLTARQRLLALIAEAFFETNRAVPAIRTIEWALREGGDAGTEPAVEQQLQTQLARYRALTGR